MANGSACAERSSAEALEWGYRPRILTEHERAIEALCTDESDRDRFRIADAVRRWVLASAMITPDLAADQARNAESKAIATLRLVLDRRHSPFAVVDEIRDIIKGAGLRIA